MQKPAEKSIPDDQLLRISDVVRLTTLSKSCINLWVAQGRFPKPITLSKTVKLWSIKNIRQWIDEQQLGQRQTASTRETKLVLEHCDE
jgi:predicted DNA-binding transcriptional regulator AlpA